MLYHAAGAAIRANLTHPVPARALVDFARVHVPVGGEVELPFEITNEMLQLVDARGKRVLYDGVHVLEISADGAGASSRQSIEVVVHVGAHVPHS